MDQCTGWVVGLDLGDRYSHFVVLDDAGEIVDVGRVRTTRPAMTEHFAGAEPVRVVMEVGTHSRWVSELLVEAGHEVLIANARKVALISQGDRKSDRVDGELLARLGRVDPELLSPVEHRGTRSHAALAAVRSRDTLVRARAKLINHVRGSVKASGQRLRSCATPHFHTLLEDLAGPLREAVAPVMACIEALTRQVKAYNQTIERLCEEAFPETELLRQVAGVGPLTALTFVASVEDPGRFEDSRAIGPYLGLVPRRDQSGEVDRQLGITKSGNPLLRRFLVSASHYILGPFGPDTDLRRWGLRLADRGGTRAKKRAIVAVARKLAVLLHRLWVTGSVYEPLYNAQRRGETAEIVA